MKSLREEFLRTNKLPHIWCPGCGNGIVTAALVRAIGKVGFEQKDVAVVSGIGCSSRAAGYLNFNTLHTTHGRALAFATGLKLAQPGLKVFVVMGDGDATAIGGNHFIHAARRNIDLNAIIINNHIYGMTGGQHSPLTPEGKKATTAPEGTLEREFNILELAVSAGATYGARGTAAQPRLLEKLIVGASQNEGFSVVEAMSTCPVSYGRRNRLGSAVDMLKDIKQRSVSVEKLETKAETTRPRRDIAEEGAEEEGETHDKQEEVIPVGVIFSRPAPEFVERYYRGLNKEKEGKEGKEEKEGQVES